MIRATEKTALDEVIESDTFTPTGRNLGFGCWGRVDVYEDQGGQEWAIKIFSPNEIARAQMDQRGWTEEDVMRREAIPLDAAAHNVVPRLIERDGKGTMYIAMPVYEGDLSSRMYSLDLNSSLKIAKEVATALKYIHSHNEYNGNFFGNPRVHGDVKPSNILIKNGRANLGDLGSTTCISIGGSGSERGPHGDINYRAPECFKEDAKPSTRADIWSLGAILYEGIAKEGIYEGLDPGDENLPKSISKKLRKVPRKLRPFLKKCLAVSEWNRFNSGDEALKELEKIIDSLGAKKTIRDYARKWTIPIGLPLALSGLLVYGAATYEPQKLEMPKANIQGMLYPPTNSKEEQKIEFEKEEIDNLPKVSDGGMAFSGLTRNAKIVTNNRIVAYLTKSYAQTQMARGMMRGGTYNDYQFRTYLAYTNHDERQFGGLNGTPWPIWAKSIEVALNQAKTGDGKVDLEDVMAISILGVDLVNQAKRASGSFDYKDYRTAKNSAGKYLISQREQNFINAWLAYYNADID